MPREGELAEVVVVDVEVEVEGELRFKWSELIEDKGGSGEGGGTRCNLRGKGTCRSRSHIDR